MALIPAFFGALGLLAGTAGLSLGTIAISNGKVALGLVSWAFGLVLPVALCLAGSILKDDLEGA